VHRAADDCSFQSANGSEASGGCRPTGNEPDELVAKKVLERSLSGMTEIACGSKEFAPLSRFPQGQAGAGGFPPRREARCAPRKSAWHASMPPAPPQEGCRPLGDPLRVLARGLDRSGTTACLRQQIGPENRPTLEDRLHQNSKLRLLQKKEKPPRRLDLTVPSHGSMHGKFGILGNVESVTYRAVKGV
jgi:hypothetical protein